MKHSLTAMLTIISAAGFAGMVQAQTTAPSTTAPSQSPQGTAPYNQYQSTAVPSYQTAPTAAPTAAPTTTPQASTQQPTMTQQPATMQQSSTMQPSTTSAYWSRNLTQDDVRQAQQQLQAEGLYRGPIDGVIGDGTKRALARFQQQNGLPRTATLDEQTMQQLSGQQLSGVATPSAGASTTPLGTAPPLEAGGANYNGQNAYTQPTPR